MWSDRQVRGDMIAMPLCDIVMVMVMVVMVMMVMVMVCVAIRWEE